MFGVVHATVPGVRVGGRLAGAYSADLSAERRRKSGARSVATSSSERVHTVLTVGPRERDRIARTIAVHDVDLFAEQRPDVATAAQHPQAQNIVAVNAVRNHIVADHETASLFHGAVSAQVIRPESALAPRHGRLHVGRQRTLLCPATHPPLIVLLRIPVQSKRTQRRRLSDAGKSVLTSRFGRAIRWRKDTVELWQVSRHADMWCDVARQERPNAN